MLRFAFHLSIALATFCCGLGVSKVLPPYHLNHNTQSQAEQAVLRVEQAYLAAHVNHDTATLARILADDFTFKQSFGRITHKQQRLALVADADFAFTDIDTSDVAVTVSGDEGFVSGRARVHVRADEQESVSPWYWYTRRYERRHGDWQVAAVETAYAPCR